MLLYWSCFAPLSCQLCRVCLQEEDAGLEERRRQSAAGLRGSERALTPAMVSHIVDALFDRSANIFPRTLLLQLLRLGPLTTCHFSSGCVQVPHPDITLQVFMLTACQVCWLGCTISRRTSSKPGTHCFCLTMANILR